MPREVVLALALVRRVHHLGPFDLGHAFGPPRLVRVYVPQRAPAHDRPLLVMFDGQNVFDDAPSFAGGWHAHKAVERLAKNVPAPVVVGIDHGHARRIGELSPVAFGHHPSQLDAFLGWITGWLLPRLRHELHVTSDPSKVVLAGSSMGGLAALYGAITRPDVFGGCISMSPSLFVGWGAMFQRVEHGPVPARCRIYLDAGAHEAGGKMLASAERMAQLLASRGVGPVMWRADPRGYHRESSWRRRLLPALRFQFGLAKRPRGR